MELTTSRAVELFLASLRTRSAPLNTIKAYRLDLQQFLKRSPTALSEVTADVIRTFLDSHEQHKPATRRRHAATLRAFYAWLMQQGLVQSNPMERLEPIGQIERLPRPLDPDDVSRILKAIPASNLRDRAIFTLLYETGMRATTFDAVRGYLGVRSWREADAEDLAAYLTTKVAQTSHPAALAEAVTEWLVRHGVLRPQGETTLERLVQQVHTRTEEDLFAQ